MSPGRPATDVTRRSIEESAATLGVGDRQDFNDVTYGVVGRSFPHLSTRSTIE